MPCPKGTSDETICCFPILDNPILEYPGLEKLKLENDVQLNNANQELKRVLKNSAT